jgi:single-strand DNA-binding protein
MIGQTPVTVIGNLTADPELRHTDAGVPVASFTVASTPRVMNRQTGKWEDGASLFLRVSAWRELATNAVETLAKGMRVSVSGVLVQSTWKDKDTGQSRSRHEVAAEDVAVSLRFATAKVTKASRNGGPPPAEPWRAGPGAADPAEGWPAEPPDDEPPF